MNRPIWQYLCNKKSSVCAWIIHSRWVKDDWLWPRMTDYGPGWHTRGQGATRGSRGAPGGWRLLPAPKRVIKQQNNGPKPWFKVPKVFPDLWGMVLTHFWGIWGHLVAFNQRYLVSTPICQQPGFLKIYIAYFFQTTWSKNLYFSEFSSQGMIHSYTGKLPKNQIIKQNLAVKSMLFWSYFLRKLDIFFWKIPKNAKNGKKIFFSPSIAFLPP